MYTSPKYLTQNILKAQQKGTKKDTDNEVKKSCLRKGENESQLRKTSDKTTEAVEHQARVAQTDARKSHNLKVVSSILTCRKF